ncbi:MAG TPA: LytTR family DNA-binding domain-containing protein [Gemmatimonadota bacterium]|nr:LytTR family DNA-binding domain-containing protein [Gemmatimonadota bacterium]
MSRRLTAVLVEDEPAALEELRDLVAGVNWLETVAEASDGATAVERIEALRPDVLFLDVHLPEMSGLEVLEAITCHPAVIFTTAYDRYAVAAFEAEAIDYLVKPFGRARFLGAVERLRRSPPPETGEPVAARARNALGGSPLARILVRDVDRLVPVFMKDVQRLEAEGEYVAVHAGARRYLVRLPISEFERLLDAERFVRIHRSHIVNLDHVRSMEPYDGARLEIRMKDGTRIVASRARTRELKDLAF